MQRKIFYEDARKNVLELFFLEFPNLKISHIELFLDMLYQLTNYEEEGQKIKPSILITSNINSVVRNIPKCKKIVFYEDQDTTNFRAHIKSFACFCKRGWELYINFGEDIIEYGIIKCLSSIKEKNLIQNLNEQSVKDVLMKKTSLIHISVYGGGVCKLMGIKGNNCSVCFNLNSNSEYNWDIEINEFVEACVSKIKTTKRKLEDIKNLLGNILNSVLKGVHGTICMVVDKEFKDKAGYFSDGTWLKEPIEFIKLFLRSSTFDESVLRSFADILATMLDFDGITIIDNAGRIRAYNVFIESVQDKQHPVIGGARRRAAYSILHNKNKKIIGVYFQSQDGDNFYKEKSDLKKKNKVKIIHGELVSDNDNMLPLEIIAKLEQAKKKEEEKKKEENEKLTEKLVKENEKLSKVNEKLLAENEKIKEQTRTVDIPQNLQTDTITTISTENSTNINTSKNIEMTSTFIATEVDQNLDGENQVNSSNTLETKNEDNNQ